MLADGEVGERDAHGQRTQRREQLVGCLAGAGRAEVGRPPNEGLEGPA